MQSSRARTFLKSGLSHYSVDLRALALMRIGLAIVVLLDLLIRSSDIVAFYSDEGIFPRWIVTGGQQHWHQISLHLLNGSPEWQALLFIIAAVFALGMLLGWQTRLMTALSWLMLLSLHHRNYYVQQGGDDLLRMMLFWAMFLPMGARYSLDSLKSRVQKKYPTNSYFSAAAIAYPAQLGFMYLFTALYKYSTEWVVDGTALYYALSLDQMVLPVGKWIYPYPKLLQIGTFFSWGLEFIVLFLLFIPYKTWLFRLITFFLLIFFHVSTGLFLMIGLFPFIVIAAILGLLPRQAMDWIESRLRSWFGLFKRREDNLSRTRLTLWDIEWSQSVVVMVILVYIFAFNWGRTVFAMYRLTGTVENYARPLRIDQYWNMFAPGVYKDDGWFVFKATTEKGDTIDLNRNGAPVNYKKPEWIIDLHKGDRWRKFSELMFYYRDYNVMSRYCEYVMREWNEQEDVPKVVHLEVIFMREFSLPDYKVAEPEPIFLSKCDSPK